MTNEPEDDAYESSLLALGGEILEEGEAAPNPAKPSPTVEGDSDSAVTVWMRPDRISFDGEQAPFVIPDGKDVQWFKIGEEKGGATTIAAQQIKEITDYRGQVVTATVGGENSLNVCLRLQSGYSGSPLADVMIFQDGAIAEAIGSVLPDGSRGEMYSAYSILI